MKKEKPKFEITRLYNIILHIEVVRVLYYIIMFMQFIINNFTQFKD